MAPLSDAASLMVKFGFLALLWVFVFAAVSVMRRDLFGSAEVSAAAPARQPAAPAAGRSRRPFRKALPNTLAVVGGSMTGATLPLGEGPITVGRGADCTLVVSDDYASTRHARFYVRNGQWFVEDLGSTNGTYVGGMRITGATPVSVGSQVRVGDTTVELRK